MKMYHLLILAVLPLACSKNKKMCQESQANPPYMEAPAEVYERDTFKVSIRNVGNNGASSTYVLKFPDMSPFNYQVTSGTADKSWYINGARMKHEGAYSFSFVDPICGDVNLSKYVTVKPLPTPCFDAIAANTMLIKDSATGVETSVACDVSLSGFGSELLLDFEAPSHIQSLTVKFGQTPEQSATYYLVNYLQNWQEQNVPVDNETQAYATLVLAEDIGLSVYRLIPLSEDIHVKREGNQITLTLCGVRLRTNTAAVDLTAKIVFEL